MSFTPNTKSTPELGKLISSGGIRKSLLTPCRRVGLSRKTKTPSSLTKNDCNSSSEINANTTPDVNLTSRNDNASLINNDTPVNHKNLSRKRLASPESTTKKSTTGIQQNKKVSRVPKSKKCLIPEPAEHSLHSTSSSEQHSEVDLQYSDDDKPLQSRRKSQQSSSTVASTQLNVKQENKENSNGTNSENITASAAMDVASKCSIDIEKSMENVFKKQRRKPKTNRRLLEETNEQNENNSSCGSPSKSLKSHADEISELSEDEGFVIKKSKKKLHCISSSSELSTSSNDIFCENEAEVSIKPNIIDKNVPKSKDDCTDTSKKVENKEEAPKKFKKRILSMKKSTESGSTNFDSDFEFFPVLTSTQKSVTSLPICTVSLEQLPILYEECQIKTEDKDDADFVTSSKNEGVDYTEEIRSITKRIKLKEEQLESLKRAELYKKKHNIEDLQALTNTWKQGCMQALSDLLCHLKAHGDINMQTLLKNLKIPSTMIACTTDGELM